MGGDGFPDALLVKIHSSVWEKVVRAVGGLPLNSHYSTMPWMEEVLMVRRFTAWPHVSAHINSC